MNWNEIPGWFQWRSAQEDAARQFPAGSRFVEVGNFLGRSLCSLGDVAKESGKHFTLIGVDTCRGSGIEGPSDKDYHGEAVAGGGGTFAGTLHKNIIACGHGDAISLIVADSITAASLFADASLDWVHLDARHDYAHVQADIAAWLPKIKPHGWLSGDDFDEVKWPDVVRAVKTALPEAVPWSVNQWRWIRETHEQHAPPPGVICTLGTHRSGTSLVSRLLNLLGVHAGADARVMTSGPDNPKGYWEYRPFVDISDAILERFGGAWDDLPTFPPEWPRDPRLDELKARARALIAEDFAASPLWGWKDPRTCVTLPFWQDVIGPMRYVVCVRSPGAVVASLCHRERMSHGKAERLWLAHMEATLAHTGGHPRLFVFYEDIMDDWPRELRRLATFIGAPERADDPHVRAAVSEFLERELCHHRMSMDDLAADPQLSFATKSLYFALRGNTHAVDLLGANAIHAWDREAAASTVAADLQRVTGEREAAARARDAAAQSLHEIQTSGAWRLVTMSRSALSVLLPLGTRRRRAFNRMLKGATGRPGARPRSG